MMILPNIQTVSFDILELVKMSFIEKRKTVWQQLLCFSVKLVRMGYAPQTMRRHEL
jgi:hypothetical protein